MKPLREESDPSDPTAARAAQLLGEVRPLARSEVSAARVRRRLQTGERAASFRTSRAALAFAVILGATASAGAAFAVARFVSSGSADSNAQGGEMGGAQAKIAHQGASHAARTDSAEVKAPEHVPKVNGTQADPAVDRAADEARDISSSEQTDGSAMKGSTRSGGAATVSGMPSKSNGTGAASDAKLVQEAVEALRNGGDAERAGELLAEYQKKAAHGPLAEEALALSIEVALSKKDPKAAELGRQYLAKYPGGRFKDLASRAARK